MDWENSETVVKEMLVRVFEWYVSGVLALIKTDLNNIYDPVMFMKYDETWMKKNGESFNASVNIICTRYTVVGRMYFRYQRLTAALFPKMKTDIAVESLK